MPARKSRLFFVIEKTYICNVMKRYFLFFLLTVFVFHMSNENSIYIEEFEGFVLTETLEGKESGKIVLLKSSEFLHTFFLIDANFSFKNLSFDYTNNGISRELKNKIFRPPERI